MARKRTCSKRDPEYWRETLEPWSVFGQAIFVLVDENLTPADLGLNESDVHPAEPTLEDVFVSLSRSQGEATKIAD